MAGDVKLTKAQITFLSRIMVTTVADLNRTSGALEDRRLIFWQPNRRTGGSWFMTETGRAALTRSQP